MGVILERKVQKDSLTKSITGTISTHLHAALAQPPPADPQEMQKRVRDMALPAAKDAAQVAAQPPTEISIKWTPFLISLGLFFVLLAIAIALDWWNMVDDPTIYSGMVTTVLGSVLGFVTGDAMGTAMGTASSE